MTNPGDSSATRENLSFIDVTGVAGFDTGNGHACFRSSPWVSSDLLASLLYGIGPAERGLIRPADAVSWSFPSDYLDCLEAAIRNQIRNDGRSMAAPKEGPSEGSYNRTP